MYIKLVEGIPQKYTLKQLRIDNPTVGFPTIPSDEVLEQFDVYPLTSAAKPSVDYTQKVVEGTPQMNENGVWTQLWETVDASEEEVTENIKNIKNEIQRQRRIAYQLEADPIFFKWKRAESDEETYLNKVTEIKERYPYPDGIV